MKKVSSTITFLFLLFSYVVFLTYNVALGDYIWDEPRLKVQGLHVDRVRDDRLAEYGSSRALQGELQSQFLFWVEELKREKDQQSAQNKTWMEFEGKHTVQEESWDRIKFMLVKNELKNERGTGSILAKYNPQLVIIDANYGAGKHKWDEVAWGLQDFKDAIKVCLHPSC